MYLTLFKCYWELHGNCTSRSFRQWTRKITEYAVCAAASLPALPGLAVDVVGPAGDLDAQAPQRPLPAALASFSSDVTLLR